MDLRLKWANLASQSDIAYFVNKTDFDNQVKIATSNKNELNELSKKVSTISTKVLTKGLIDKFSILNEANYRNISKFCGIYTTKNALKIYWHCSNQIVGI